LVPAEPEGYPEFDFILGGTQIPQKIWKSDDLRIPTILTLPYDSYGICEWKRSKPEENWGTLAKI